MSGPHSEFMKQSPLGMVSPQQPLQKVAQRVRSALFRRKILTAKIQLFLSMLNWVITSLDR